MNEVFAKLSEEITDKKLLDNLISEYPFPDVVEGFTDALLISKTLSVPDAAMLLKNADGLKVRKTEVKTVGTFISRIGNGGAERCISLLCKAWTDAGYKVLLFTEEPPNEDDYPVPDGVKRVIVPAAKLNDKSSFVKRSEVFRKYITEYDVDTFVYNPWMNIKLMVDGMVIKSLGVPFSVYMHGFFVTGFLCGGKEMAVYQREAYSFCDAVLTLSRADTYWWQSIGVPCRFILNPPPVPFDGRASSKEGKTAVWVGRISAEKQPVDALKAALVIKKSVPDFVLRIYGRFTDENTEIETKKFITENGMEDYVHLMGYVTDTDEIYKDASVLIHTSRFEGSPLVYTESAAYGIPIVAYDIPHIELSRESKGVITVPQGDGEALAKEVIKLLSDEKQLTEKSNAIYNDAAKMYGKKKLNDQWKEVFMFAALPDKKKEKNGCEDRKVLLSEIDYYISAYPDFDYFVRCRKHIENL